jgi:flagellum-specific peptidoglycan hydrolase FlgJ
VNPESEVSESEYPESIESISMDNDKFKSKDDFLTKMTYIYKKVLKEKGINEDFAVYLVAQDALESG